MTQRKKSHLIEDAKGLLKDLVETMAQKAPKISNVVGAFRVFRELRDERRVNKLFLIACDVDENFEPTDPRVVDAIKDFATSDEDVMAVVNHWLNADEEEKQWFFGALLRAFALGEVCRRSERLRMLKFVDLVIADDLNDFIQLASIGFRALGKPEIVFTPPVAGQPVKIGLPHMSAQEPVMLALNQLGLLQGFNPALGLDGRLPLKPEPDTPMWRLMSICDVARRSREQLGPVLK